MQSEPRAATVAREPRPEVVETPWWRRGFLDRWTTVGLPALVLLLTFILPARYVVPGLGALGRPAFLLATGIGVLWLLAQLRTAGRPAQAPAARWLLAGVWLSYLVSFAVGFDRGLSSAEASASTRALIEVLSITGLVLTIAEGVRGRSDLMRMVQTIVVGGTVMATVGVLQSFGFNLLLYIRPPFLALNGALIGVSSRGGGARVAGTASHYIEFGTVAAMILPLAIFLWRVNGSSVRSWLMVAVVLLGVAVPFSISRTSFLAGAVALLVCAVAWGWRTRFNMLVAMGVAIVALQVLQPGLLGTIKSLFLNAADDPSVQARTDDYPFVNALVHDRPWFGRGPGTFIPDEYFFLDNMVLGIILERGYFGAILTLLLFAGAVLFAATAALRRGQPYDMELGFSIAGAVLAGIVVSFTFDSLGFPVFATTLYAFVGLAFAFERVTRHEVVEDELWPEA